VVVSCACILVYLYTCTCAAAALYSLLATMTRNFAWMDGVKQNWRTCFRFLLLLLRLRFAQIVVRVSNFQLNLHTCDDDRKAMRRCVRKGSCFLVIFRPYRILSFAEPEVPSAYMLHHCLLHTVCSPLPCDTNTDTSRRTETAERSGCNNTIQNICIHESVCNSLYPVLCMTSTYQIRSGAFSRPAV
jgi:hypothetical protein